MRRNKKVLFCRIGWMTNYKGVTKMDKPVGAGAFVDKNHDGGEVYNFAAREGNYYGYVRISNGGNISIQRLGAKVVDDSVDDVLIVFFSRNPETGGQFVLGWYEYATVHRSIQHFRRGARKNHANYNLVGKVSNAHLIPEDDRIFEVPDKDKGGPGQMNIWYAGKNSHRKFFKDFLKYKENPSSFVYRETKRRPSLAFQKNAELRRKVEVAAMDRVEEYFSKRNFKVKYVETENLGWDMEAEKNGVSILLEVKGLSNSFESIILTPNEYKNSKRNRNLYRICVVSHALSNTRQKLEIFSWKNRCWVNLRGDKLKLEERIGAIASTL